MSAPMTEQRLNFARTLTDPNFSLSVPDNAKQVIRELLADRDALIEAAKDHRQTAARALTERDQWRKARDKRNTMWLNEKERADRAEATLTAVRNWAEENRDDLAHEGADTRQLLELLDSRVDQGPAEPSIYELSDDDLPGMWSRSDFMGGQDEAEEYARKIDGAARVIAGLSERLWDQALEDAPNDPLTLGLVRYYRERARTVLEVVKA